jgi:hypothetical protein
MPVVNTPPPPLAAKKPVTARQSQTVKARTAAVGGVFQLAGFAAMMTGNLADAGAVGKHAEPITAEIVKLAETDEKIASVVDKLANVGPYGALLTVLVPLVTQILVNHGRIQAGPAMAQMGVVPKAILESEVHMAMAEAELHAQLMQQEAEAQLARVKAALADNANPNGRGPDA